METPSSVIRVTRSQTSTTSHKTKQDSRTTGSSDRSALVDITNDSPIVGVAMGSLAQKTPSSLVAKNGLAKPKKTPGSGEALLRGQVKTLLQKVEEEAELANKIPSDHRPPFRVLLAGLPCSSPAVILGAPTPANTPQIPGLPVMDLPSVVEGEDSMAQVAEAMEEEEEPLGPLECHINRALLFDSPGKSESSDASADSSSLTYQGSSTSSYLDKSRDDDSSSAWSIQVNVSTQDEDEEKVTEDFEEEGAEEDGESFDELCKGLSKMSMIDDEKTGLPEFTGKHTRFVYNSDDELEKEEEVRRRAVSPNVMLLKGLPVPEGKHLRFQDEEEE